MCLLYSNCSNSDSTEFGLPLGPPLFLGIESRQTLPSPKRILHQFDSIPCKMNPFTLFMVALAAVAVAQTVSGPHSLAPPFNSFTWSGTFPTLLRNR